jgi:hypothetical protein
LIFVLGWPIPGVSTAQYNALCQFNVLPAVPQFISYSHPLPRTLL